MKVKKETAEKSPSKATKVNKTKTKNSCERTRSPYFKKSSNDDSDLRLKMKSFGAGNRVKWKPPSSPYNLIQETLYKEPWKLLVATIFLNKTRGQGAIPNLMKFFEKWPSPHSLRGTEVRELSAFLQPIGLHNVRAKTILKFSGKAKQIVGSLTCLINVQVG